MRLTSSSRSLGWEKMRAMVSGSMVMSLPEASVRPSVRFEEGCDASAWPAKTMTRGCRCRMMVLSSVRLPLECTSALRPARSTHAALACASIEAWRRGLTFGEQTTKRKSTCVDDEAAGATAAGCAVRESAPSITWSICR